MNPVWRLGEGFITIHFKCPVCYEMLRRASDLARSWEHGNEPVGSIKGEEFLDSLSDYWLLKKDSALWSYSIR